MKNVIFSLLISFISVIVYSQKPISGTSVISYSIDTPTDTIEYVRLDTSTIQKPVLLFLQGSMPIPLIIQFDDYNNYKHVNIPFDLTAATDNYHIVIISMPKTPMLASVKHLNNQYCFITDSADQNSFLTAYLEADYLSNYVNRANLVIADLIKNQKWANTSQIHLIGHSQGAKIAAVVAAENKNIASVNLLGFNAFGRYDELIRKERQHLNKGEITKEEYIESSKGFYLFWEEMVKNPTDINSRTWLSFSIDYRPYLLKANCPIFIGYGTNDIGAENCDLLPLDFIKNGITNYKVKPYISLDHNFFELKNGIPDYENGAHWTAVFSDVLEWIEKE